MCETARFTLRGVFLATVGAAAMRGAVEYYWYLSCELPGSTLVWPATAPAVPHTVVVAAAEMTASAKGSHADR